MRELLPPGGPLVRHILRRQKHLRGESLQNRLPQVGQPPVRHFAPDHKRIGEFSSSPSPSPPSFPRNLRSSQRCSRRGGKRKVAAADDEQGTGRKRRDAPYGPCRLRLERRARVLVGHFRLKLSEPRHSSRQGKHYQNSLYFFIYHSYIHTRIHSIRLKPSDG